MQLQSAVDQPPTSFKSIKEVLLITNIDTSKLKEAYETIDKDEDSPRSFIHQTSAINFKFDDDEFDDASSQSSVLRFENNEFENMDQLKFDTQPCLLTQLGSPKVKESA